MNYIWLETVKSGWICWYVYDIYIYTHCIYWNVIPMTIGIWILLMVLYLSIFHIYIYIYIYIYIHTYIHTFIEWNPQSPFHRTLWVGWCERIGSTSSTESIGTVDKLSCGCSTWHHLHLFPKKPSMILISLPNYAPLKKSCTLFCWINLHQTTKLFSFYGLSTQIKELLS